MFPGFSPSENPLLLVLRYGPRSPIRISFSRAGVRSRSRSALQIVLNAANVLRRGNRYFSAKQCRFLEKQCRTGGRVLPGQSDAPTVNRGGERCSRTVISQTGSSFRGSFLGGQVDNLRWKELFSGVKHLIFWVSGTYKPPENKVLPKCSVCQSEPISKNHFFDSRVFW